MADENEFEPTARLRWVKRWEPPWRELQQLWTRHNSEYEFTEEEWREVPFETED